VAEIPVKKGKVVEVLSTDTLTHGFSLLVEHGILSAPVWDVENKAYTGFLDMRDLVSFAVFAHKERQAFQTLQELVDSRARASDQVSANLTVTCTHTHTHARTHTCTHAQRASEGTGL
jgi:CBS-domain-containing membrane protein